MTDRPLQLPLIPAKLIKGSFSSSDRDVRYCVAYMQMRPSGRSCMHCISIAISAPKSKKQKVEQPKQRCIHRFFPFCFSSSTTTSFFFSNRISSSFARGCVAKPNPGWVKWLTMHCTGVFFLDWSLMCGRGRWVGVGLTWEYLIEFLIGDQVHLACIACVVVRTYGGSVVGKVTTPVTPVPQPTRALRACLMRRACTPMETPLRACRFPSGPPDLTRPHRPRPPDTRISHPPPLRVSAPGQTTEILINWSF